MKNRKYLFLIILIFSFNLVGCVDKKEVDDQVYAIAIGADKGVGNKIRLTLQYPVYQEGKGGEGQDAQNIGNTIVNTVEAASILEGLDLLSTSTSRRISLVHTKVIVFSEEFAKDGIGGFMQPIARFRETRRIMQILVCKGTAEEFINGNKTFIGKGIAKALELKERNSRLSGLFARSTFHNFYKSILSPYEQPYTTYAGINNFQNLRTIADKENTPLIIEPSLLPGEVPKRGNLKNEYVGTAVFNGNKMVGVLDAYETRYFLMVIDEFEKGMMTIEDEKSPGDAIILDTRPGRKPKIKAYFKGGRPVIDVSINIEADVVSIQSRLPYEEGKKIKDLNKQLEEHIKKGVEKVITKAKNEFGTDIFRFGYKIARHFSTIQEFEKYNWLNHFPDAAVNVDVKANVRRTGLMIRSSEIRYSEEKKE